MSKRCQVSGKSVQTGNNVSHANNKTRRRFMPNLQSVGFFSETLGKVSMRISVAALRTIEKNGGIEAYLENTANSKLSTESLKLKKRLQKMKKAS